MVDNNLTYAVKRRALDKVSGDRNFIYSYFLSLTYMAWDNSSSFNQISNSQTVPRYFITLLPILFITGRHCKITQYHSGLFFKIQKDFICILLKFCDQVMYDDKI